MRPVPVEAGQQAVKIVRAVVVREISARQFREEAVDVQPEMARQVAPDLAAAVGNPVYEQMSGRFNGAAREHEGLCLDLSHLAIGGGVFDGFDVALIFAYYDARHRRAGQQSQIACLYCQRNGRIGRSVFRLHVAAEHALAAVMTDGTFGLVRLGQDGFSQGDELHLLPARLESLNASLQRRFRTAHRHAFQELTIGQIRQAVFVSVDTHQALGSAVIRRDLFVADRPLPKIEGPEAEAMPRPTEGAPAQSLEQPVARRVADRREVVALEAQARCVVAPRAADALVDFIRPRVRAEINPGAQGRAGLDQRDLQSGLGQRVSGDATARAAADDPYVKYAFRHVAHLSFCLRYAIQPDSGISSSSMKIYGKSPASTPPIVNFHAKTAKTATRPELLRKIIAYN